MLNVVLLCQFGASTGMLAENIRKRLRIQEILKWSLMRIPLLMRKMLLEMQM